MSATRIMVMGVLSRADRPMHGYEIRQVLQEWGAEYWADLAYGSIYFSLAKMTEEGLLTAAGTDTSGKGPARKLYALTEQGRAAFLELLREYWGRYKPPVDRMSIAMTFMDFLPPEEVLNAMRARATGFRRAIEQYPELIELKRRHAGNAVAESVRRAQVRDEAELAWLDDVIAKVEKGELP